MKDSEIKILVIELLNKLANSILERHDKKEIFFSSQEIDLASEWLKDILSKK